jgi:uncharacterized protein YrrD
MLRYSEILGLPVICADSGKKSGIVKDIIFSPGEREVKAILLENKGISLKKKVVQLREVLNIGDGAVILDNAQCVAYIGRSRYAVEFADEGCILGLKVFSKTGDDMGIVKDVVFDWKSGRIEGFEISDGLLQDIIQGRKVMPLSGRVEFGEDSIIVEKEAVDEMLDIGGGLRNKLLMKKIGKE